MNNKNLNLTLEKFDVSNIVRARNKYIVSDWMLFYNEKKNSAKIKFDVKDLNTLAVSITDSNGWVRILKSVTKEFTSGFYSLELTTRALTTTTNKTVEPFLFLESREGKFEKHTKFKTSEGKFAAKFHKQNDGANVWVGFETTDDSIELYINHIRLNIEEIEEEKTDGKLSKSEVFLPIAEKSAKSDNYKKISGHNAVYRTKIKEDEYHFLLEYASCLRRVEMSQTYIRLIRLLTLRYKECDSQYLEELLFHIQNVLKLSRDDILVDILLTNCPNLLFSLDLDPEVFEKITNLSIDDGLDGQSVNIRKALYSYRADSRKTVTFVMGQVRKDADYFTKQPQALCALANTFLASRSAKSYQKFVNNYLLSYGLPRIKSIDIDSESNILNTVSFESMAVSSLGPKISVIMSAYNCRESIEYAIRSIVEQTYKNIEILICDDGSDDETVQVLNAMQREFEFVRIFQSKENQGTYNIRNDLIRYSTGEYITFHDSDDFALPNRLELQIGALLKQGSKICFSHWIRLMPNGEFVFFHDGQMSRFCAVSAFAHRSVFELLPDFRPSVVAADTEFHELCKNTFGENQITVLDKPLILGSWGKGSLTRSKNLTAEPNGFVARKRREYSDIAARQRLLGSLIVTNEDVEAVLKEQDIYRERKGVVALSKELE